MTIIEDYMNEITSRCEKKMLMNKNLSKIDNKDTKENIILNIHNYNELTKYNYNIQQLKSMTKFYKLKLSGNKKELLNRVFIFLYLSSYIVKIQKIFRGVLYRKFLSFFGPAIKNRSICTNETDFVTMDNLNELPLTQFFS